MKSLLEDILNNPFPLSDVQKDAVASNSRYIRIIAGAGAGKTETLARKILFYLLYKNIEPSEIVAFTFTEKAAQSMKSRIHQRLLELGKNDLLKKFGEMYVGTIHGYCSKLLQEKFGMSDFSVLDENQLMAFIIREGYAIGLNNPLYNKHGSYLNKCKVFISTLGVYYSELIDKSSIAPNDVHFITMLERYEDKLRKHHKLTFDTLITNTIAKLTDTKNKNNIKCLIVDEFQDINRAQYELIKLLSKNSSLIIVGDPRQSIYQWRGGNPEFFQNFVTDFKDVRTYEIVENRRSQKDIVDMSNSISENFSSVQFSHMICSNEKVGVIAKTKFENAQEEASEIADEIQRITKNGNISYSNFSILLRSIRTSADPLIEALKSRKIPYIIGGKVGLFKRGEAQSLAMFICWLWEGGYWQDSQNKNTITGEELRNEAINLWEKSTNRKLIEPDVLSNLHEWKCKVLSLYPNDDYGYKDILHELLNILKYKELDPKNDLDAVIMANIGSFSTILGDFESSFRLGGKRSAFSKELRDLCNFLNGYAQFSYDEQPSESEVKLNAVILTTIHQSKGLEWPVVFLPSMINRRFPSTRTGDPKSQWMADFTGLISTDYFEKKDSELRLLYVAVTRASNVIIMSHFLRHSKKSASPSEYFHILDNFCHKVDKLSTLSIENYIKDGGTLADDIESYAVKELIEYELCAYHYRLSKKWHYIQGVNTFMGYGEALHNILRETSERINEGEKYEEALDKASENFHLPYASSDLKDKLRSRAKKELHEFIKDKGDYLKNVKETEMRIEFPARNATIVGKADVILDTNNGFEIRDYKSSERVMKKEYSDFQIRLYAKGLQELGWKITRGSVANLKDNDLEEVEVSTVKLDETLKKAERIIEKIKNQEFDPKISDFCEMCEYNKICYKCQVKVRRIRKTLKEARK